MKKFLVLAVCAVLSFGMVTATAQSKEYKKEQKANAKAAEKAAKQQAKTLKKEKWEYSGAIPLETALASYYEKLTDFGGTMEGQEHEVNDAKSVSIAEKRLLLDAQTAYAQEVKTMLGADLANQASSRDGVDMDVYAGRVAAKVMHEFNGDVRRAILLKKKNPNGKTWTVRGYYLIDIEGGAARAARVAKAIEENNGLIDNIHEKVFGNGGE